MKIMMDLTTLIFDLIWKFLCFFTDLILADNNLSSSNVQSNHVETMFSNGPYLDGNEISNVTTQISTHAYLPCKVSFHQHNNSTI